MQSYSCFICKNHLIDPIVLKECQHSFCKICYKSTKSNIISLFEKFDPQKNRLQIEYECPICQMKSTELSMDNIESLFKVLEKDERETIYPTKTPAGFFDFFIDYYCPEHEDQKIEYFDCKTKKFVCLQDCLKENKTQKIREIDPEIFLRQFYENLDSLELKMELEIEKVKEKQKEIQNIRNQFEYNKIHIKGQIVDYFDQIVQVVNQQKLKYLNLVESISRDKHSKLLQQSNIFCAWMELFQEMIQKKKKLRESKILSSFQFAETHKRIESIYQRLQSLLKIPICQQDSFSVQFLEKEKRKIIKSLESICQLHSQDVKQNLNPSIIEEISVHQDGWMEKMGPFHTFVHSLNSQTNTKKSSSFNNNNKENIHETARSLVQDNKKNFHLSEIPLMIKMDVKQRSIFKLNFEKEFSQKVRDYPKMRAEISCQLAERYKDLHYYQESLDKYLYISTKFNYPPAYVGVYLFYHDNHFKEIFPENIEIARTHMSLILKNIPYYEKEVEKYRQTKQKINPLCPWIIAFIYANGLGSKKTDPYKAFEYWQIAAELGYLQGWNDLGSCYLYGDGVKKDLQKSFQLFQFAAERGNVNGQIYLADSYRKGIGVEENMDEAIRWLQIASDHSKSALTELGNIYLEMGKGMEKAAIECFEKVKKMGKPEIAEAKINLLIARKIFQNTDFQLTPTEQSELENLLSSCKKSNNSISIDEWEPVKELKSLCIHFENPQTLDQSPFHFTDTTSDQQEEEKRKNQLIETFSIKESPEHQFILALAYLHIQKDPIKSYQLLQKSAQSGNSFALKFIALFYQRGIGVQKNLSITHFILSRMDTGETDMLLAEIFLLEEIQEDWGLYYLFKACRKNYPEANLLIYSILTDGSFGLKKNNEKATEHLRKAADTNHPGALFKLGQIHHLTMPHRAIEYYKKAIQYGSLDAVKSLKSLEE